MQDIKYTTKTVIKEDGTYGTELQHIQPDQINLFTDDRYKKVSDALMNDSVFVVNFYRNILLLISKSEKHDPKLNKISGLYVYAMFTVYKYHQKIETQDKTMFRELSILIKKMVSKEYEQI